MSGGGAAAVAALGALVVVAAGAADWATTVVARDVGGIAVASSVGTPGTAVAPLVIALGLLALGGAAAVAALRRAARRVASGIVAAIGVATVVAVVAGAFAAGRTGGTLTAAPGVAGAGAVAVAAAGIGALRRPVAGRARSAYAVDEAERASDDEWSLASAEEPAADEPGVAEPAGDGRGVAGPAAPYHERPRATRSNAEVSGFLAQVCAEARERVAEAVRACPLPALRDRAAQLPAPPSFATALAANGTAVIAEVKRASPSRGRIAAIPDAAALARAYRDGGAAAVSVLTEFRHFDGTLDDLTAVAAAVDVPVLRKDFVVDAYQVLEARAAGAAAVLLIVAALSDDELAGLVAAADATGLDALVEAHDADELVRAGAAWAAAGSPRRLVVGVNARDLATLTVDVERFAALRDAVPPGALAVAESGVRDAADVARLADLGADAVLVGESVATAADPAAAVGALVAAGRRDVGAGPVTAGRRDAGASP